MKKICIYCKDWNESTHFLCEKCWVWMCDDCYDLDREHTWHYHQICEVCEDDLYKKLLKEFWHEPDYICEKCVSIISDKK
jgi:hypothetical protein